MARIAYNSRDATAFEATRHVPEQGLAGWREAIARHLRPWPGMRVLDLGSGTGMWAQALTCWYDGVEVVPAEAMRARCVHPQVLAGDAAAIPLLSDSVDAAWMSTVIHHVPDLASAAGELRRVLRSEAPVLIRSAFAGHHDAITLFRFFPEAIRVLNTYPSVEEVESAFATAGFATVAFETIPQTTAPSLLDIAALKRHKSAVLTDRASPRPLYPEKELIKRLQAGRCEWCQQPDTDPQVHHVRQLADLDRHGEPWPAWAQIMKDRRRKALVVCGACHDLIHGRAAAMLTS